MSRSQSKKDPVKGCGLVWEMETIERFKHRHAKVRNTFQKNHPGSRIPMGATGNGWQACIRVVSYRQNSLEVNQGT